MIGWVKNFFNFRKMCQRKRSCFDNACCLSIKNFFTSKSKAPTAAIEEHQEHLNISVPVASSSTALLKVQSVSSNKTYQSWIKLKGFDESLQMNVFTPHADGGIICLLCSSRGKTAYIYTSIPAKPQCPSRLDNHLNSD